MNETVIQVTSLGKRIKGKTILEEISFEINKGDCVALIGPNGAGKTVLMSCILGDKKPSNGQVLIDGKAGKAKNKIAVLLQENTIPNSLKVEELIAPTIQGRPVSAVCGQTLWWAKTSSGFCPLFD